MNDELKKTYKNTEIAIELLKEIDLADLEEANYSLSILIQSCINILFVAQNLTLLEMKKYKEVDKNEIDWTSIK